VAEIKLTGVDKVYPGGTHAVHGVDLHIADGEFMIMVGPSGCAKSTILRMIAGLEVPTGGTIEIGGRVVNDVAPKDRDIAMVFQSYALYPHMTVRDNMAFGLRLRNMSPSEIDQRVAEAARILGLENLLDRLPKAMSGGQRQRVAMGRAIVREPQAFLMDEPLSNLDAKLREQMRTEIAKLHQRLRTTTVYVTHDQVEALTLGQRICILRKGVVQQVNTPYEVYQNPANVFVGGFIGSPGMNFMSGHLVLHDGVVFLQIGEHHLALPASVTSRLLATENVNGRPVVVGIRPEHLDVAPEGTQHALPVQVELVEAMGSETYAYFSAAVATPDLSALSDTQATADTFVARLGAGVTARGGDRVHLLPDLDEVHLFDPQSMLTLLAPADEAEVRQRQARNTGVASPIAMPATQQYAPTQTVMQPMQPVIHLHQTFVQGEDGQIGATIDADPAAVAAVFDQPVASPMTLEPLMPAAVNGTPAPAAGHGIPSPRREATPGAHPRPSFVTSVTSESSMAFAPTTPAYEPPPTPDAQRTTAAPPASETQSPPEAPTAPAPRGFAPRAIGPTPPAVTPPAPEPAARLDATAAELDAAIDALPTNPVAPRVPTIDRHGTAGTGFRDALRTLRTGPSLRGEPSAPPSSALGRVELRRLRFDGPSNPAGN
jgi:multiple sugar transport system ATP-binding protein